MRVLPAAPEPRAVDAASAVLEAGGCVAIPTDTVYGLAASVRHPQATERLVVLKGRPKSMPIAVLVASEDAAWSVAEPSALARRLAAEHWPGGLTLVMDAKAGLSPPVCSAEGTVGVRLPDHSLVRAIAARVGPIAATSANPHGAPTPPSAAGVAEAFADLDLVIDGGLCAHQASTVVDARGPEPVVLRQGEVLIDHDGGARSATEPAG